MAQLGRGISDDSAAALPKLRYILLPLEYMNTISHIQFTFSTHTLQKKTFSFSE